MESTPRPRVVKTKHPAVDVELPATRQTWLNFQVWMPFLMNPGQRERLVKYSARESRHGGSWSLLLPQQCWECGTTQEVQAREYTCHFRGFDQMLRLLAIGGTFAFCLLVLAWFFRSPILGLIFLGVLLLIALIGYLKSWKESVRLVTWSCKTHEGQMAQPEMAVADEDLHVFLATPKMAEHARKALTAQRRSGGKYTQADQGQPSIPMESTDLPKGKTFTATQTSADGKVAPPPAAPGREQLPSIKLDDDLYSE